ncbi:MAG: MarR family transcriptional regulator [Gammaproteobacteria bacterium]|nr:MarR family transcriptional regulator [Gammaproteobacteria bacterium]
MSDSSVQPDVLPQQRLTGLIHEVSLMLVRLFNRQVRKFGLTRTQWQLLYWLRQADGRTQTELAETLFMAKPPLGRVVDRLEEQGWVVRRDDANDRRVKLVYLTEKINPLIAPLEKIVDDLVNVAVAGLSAPDRQKLSDLMIRTHANLSDAINRE